MRGCSSGDRGGSGGEKSSSDYGWGCSGDCGRGRGGGEEGSSDDGSVGGG